MIAERLAQAVRDGIRQIGEIAILTDTQGAAYALLALPAAQQITTATEIAGKKLSVRDAEKLVSRVAAGAGRQAPLLRVASEKARDIQRLESELSDRLTAAVEIRVKKRGRQGEQGEIAIRFDSLDELNGLLARLGVGN